jgi:hypothetical protein
VSKQLSLLYNKQEPQRVLDCLRYEEIQGLWRTALPRAEDIEWCAVHMKRCGTGAHLLTRPEAEPWAILSTLTALDRADGHDAEEAQVE